MKRAFLLLALSLLALGLPGGTAHAGYAEDEKAVAELLKQNREVERTDPEKAAAAYRAFLEAHGDLHPGLTMKLVTPLVDLLSNRLKEADKALQLCDWAMETYKDNPYWASVAVVGKLKLLNDGKRYAETQAWVEENWDRVMAGAPDQVGPAVQAYVAALDAQGKRKEGTDAVFRALRSNSDLYWWYRQGVPMGWMYDRIVKDLIAKEQLDEALRWGKLFFVTCGPKQNGVDAAVECLGRIWMAKYLSDERLKALREALQDPAKPNPLADIKLPEVDVEAVTARVERPVVTVNDLPGLVDGLVVLGRMRQALLAAKEWQAKFPYMTEPAKSILKAAHLNLKVVEDYDTFVRTGIGPNPLDELAKKLVAEADQPAAEQPAQPAAEQPAAQPAPAAGTQTLGYARDTADDKRSLPGTGFAVSFERPDAAKYLTGVRICAARTGGAEGSFTLYLLDEKMQPLAMLPFPYATVQAGDLRWVDLAVRPVEVPKRFSIGLDFRPDANRAIHLGFNRVEETHSFVGLPAKGYQKMTQPIDWMVQAVISDRPAGK